MTNHKMISDEHFAELMADDRLAKQKKPKPFSFVTSIPMDDECQLMRVAAWLWEVEDIVWQEMRDNPAFGRRDDGQIVRLGF